MLHSRPTLVSKPLIPHLPNIYLLPLPPTTVPCSWLSFCASCLLPPDSLRVFQWIVGGLRARSTELFHFFSSHPVDLICIQESNLNSSSSFRIPGFSALRCDRTYSRSGILSHDTTHANGGFLIFVSSNAVDKQFLPKYSTDDPTSALCSFNFAATSFKPRAVLDPNAPYNFTFADRSFLNLTPALSMCHE